MGHVEAICISTEKGTVKQTIPKGHLILEWGIEGDAHAGNWHRQVSLLMGERIDDMRKLMPSIADGAFAENLVTRETDLSRCEIGDRLRIGEDILLEVTQIGKECHHGCEIQQVTGRCIMPTEGIFTRVIQGGWVTPGDAIQYIGKRREGAGNSLK